MDRLDETLHDAHHELALESDKRTRRCKDRGRPKLIQRKSVPAVSSLAAKAQVDRQGAGVDLSRRQCRIDLLELDQREVSCGGAGLFNRETRCHAGLAGLREHANLFATEL